MPPPFPPTPPRVAGRVDHLHARFGTAHRPQISPFEMPSGGSSATDLGANDEVAVSVASHVDFWRAVRVFTSVDKVYQFQ